MTAELHFIGRIETPYQHLKDCPRNVEPDGPVCKLVLFPEYADGALGMDISRKLMVLYWFEKVNRSKLTGTSGKTGKHGGVFAMRSPYRPNPIAVAVVKIEKIEGATIYVRGLDCLDNTPLLDLKPASDGEEATCGHP